MGAAKVVVRVVEVKVLEVKVLEVKVLVGRGLTAAIRAVMQAVRKVVK